jgi:hypothetical protein
MHQKSNHCTQSNSHVHVHLYVNDFDTVELHLYSVVTLKLDYVKH